MKSDEVYLKHIRDSVYLVESYLDGVEYNEFVKNSMIIDAVVRQLSVI